MMADDTGKADKVGVELVAVAVCLRLNALSGKYVFAMPIPSCNHSCYESMSACSLCVLRTCHHAAAALEQPCCVTFAMNGGVPLSRSDDDHIVKISVSSAPSNGSCSKCGVDQRAHDLSKATSPRRRTLRLVRSVRTLSRNAKNISEMIAALHQ